MARKASGEPGWMWRRWVIFPNVIVSYALLVLLILFGGDSEVNEVIASGCMWNIIGSIAIYTGFATMQDITAIWRTRSGLPYNQESSPAEPAAPVEVTAESGAKVEVQAG